MAKHIRAVPRARFAVERMHLETPAGCGFPKCIVLHPRTVDVEGYVLGELHSLLGSGLLGSDRRTVEVRETRRQDRDAKLDARHIVARHERALTPLAQRITLAAHRPPRGEGVKRNDPHPE